MYIKKVKIDAIKINREDDIPDFLRDTIKIMDCQILCYNAESHGEYISYPLGSVIGYDTNANTPTGKGAWQMDEGSYVESDDGSIKAPQNIRLAEPICAPFSLETTNGTQTLDAKYGYLVTCTDGRKNILSCGTTSETYYVVCTHDGTEICPLPEYPVHQYFSDNHLEYND